MIEINDKKQCCGCHACFNICPKNAIKMIEDENGFKVPKVDQELCINCNLCKKVCPIVNNSKIENEPIAYAMYSLDEDVRKKSSSGGIFTLIAKEILKINGVVFGAKFNEDFEVEHDFIENEKELYKFMGAKYIQSTIGNNYKKVKEFLDSDRYVLFTGTPCQIEGLKNYLAKDYEKLYTQDIICHGVPAPSVWRKYLKYRNNQSLGKLIQVNFRNKDIGWNRYSTNFKYENGEYKKNHNEDLFMNAFLSDLCLRESCYDCKFKKKKRISDITLGDFWGIDNVIRKFNDNKGVSLVIVNSAKGEKLIEAINGKTEVKRVNLDEAIKFNKSMIESANESENRNIFLERIKTGDFSKVVNKYKKKEKIIKKIKRKLKKILSQKKRQNV